MKIAMACVANHTISCDKEKYGSVNMRVKHISEHFRKVCRGVVELPPKKCMPPPAMPFGKDGPKDKGHGGPGDHSHGGRNETRGGGMGDGKGMGGGMGDGKGMSGGMGDGKGMGGGMGDGKGMGNMSMPSTVELIKRMAKYSLFPDALLCQ